MTRAWWIIAIADAAALRMSYVNADKSAAHGVWLASAERSQWFAMAVPHPSTWLAERLQAQAEGAKVAKW